MRWPEHEDPDAADAGAVPQTPPAPGTEPQAPPPGGQTREEALGQPGPGDVGGSAPPGDGSPEPEALGPDGEPALFLPAESRPRSRRGRRGWQRTVGVALAGAVAGGALVSATPLVRVWASPPPGIATAPESAAATAGAPAVAVYKNLAPSVVLVTNQGATTTTPFGATQSATDWGSGVIFTSSGYIVTNDHVLASGGTISVTLSTGKTYSAKVVGTDPSTDLAVLKINAAGPLPAATFANSDDVVPGEAAIAIGNPLGPSYSDSVTEGIVSAVRPMLYGYAQNTERVTKMIQTDAAINPGNSGGALANAAGQVIGITSMKIGSAGQSGLQAAGMGFAIPSNVVAQVVNQLVQYGYVKRPYLGVDIHPSPSQVSVPTQPQTLTITTVVAGTPAAGKLQAGDVISTWNGQKVVNYLQLVGDINAASPGQTVSLGVVRSGHAVTVKITLGTEPRSAQTQPAPSAQTQPQTPFPFPFPYGNPYGG